MNYNPGVTTMARKSKQDEAEAYVNLFFEETEAKLMADIKATRQRPRRAALLAELDVLDKVKGRFYYWSTSKVAA